jgi:TRAP transporter TAXI family solute receptor
MKSISNFIALVMILLTTQIGSAQPSGAQEFKKAIMTGGPSGTYIQIGKDLASISAGCSYTLGVEESAGSLENLVAVKTRTNTQFGIVQSDVLEYVKTYSQADPELQRSLFGVRIMFPLYNEEVHLLAKRSIQNLSDLTGKKVAVGKVDSGTFLTASLILDVSKQTKAERLPVGSAEALPMLLDGRIDALFYVAGAPTKLFNDPSIDGSAFHLVDITEEPLKAIYTSAVIPDGTYPFQPEPTNTVAVKAVLMTYDYTPSKNVYHQQSCKAVADLSNIILTNLDTLKETGHPKWKDVDLTAVPPGWRVGDCVKQGMAQNYKVACEPRPVNAVAISEPDQEYLNLLKQRLKQ